MRQLIAVLLAVAFCCLPVSAIDSYASIYVASKSTTLAGTGETITIQNPSSAKTKMVVKMVYVKCSVACDFTVERDGTAATSTPLAFDKGSKASAAPVGVAFSSSNVGVGAFRWPYTVPTGGCSCLSVQFTGVDLPGDGTSSNFSVKVASMTGTVFVLVQWEEL